MRFGAQLISVVFHPLLVLTYGLVILLAFNPYAFGVNSIFERIPLVVLCFAYTFLLPFLSILFMKMLGMVETLELQQREERIGPLIICIVFYTWFFLNMNRNMDTPPVLSTFILGSVIALGISFFVTVFSKLSLHAVGMGGLFGLNAIMFWHFGYDQLLISGYLVHMRLVLLLLLVLGGIVASIRMWLGAHVPKEIYGGLLVGFASQFIALRYLS